MTQYAAHPRPSGGIELYAWLFMRVSGLALLFLALGHFFIMHVFNSVYTIDYNFVAQRYLGLFWRGYDLTMLWLAMVHGANGARTLIDDYCRPPFRGWGVKILYVAAGSLLILGTWVIIMFQPATARMGL